jgi:hypothetical protein
MADSIGIVLVHDDREIAEQVTEALEQAPDLFVTATAPDGAAGAVVVAGGDALARLGAQDRPVVALAGNDLVRAARAALVARAADLVVWPSERERLAAAVRRAARAGARSAVSAGRAVAVAGARGGVGASAFAALLAAEMGALVLDCSGGQSLFAADEPARTVESLRGAPDDPTPEALDAIRAPHAAGTAIYGGVPASARHARALLRAARSLAEIVVVDAGTGIAAGQRAALADADARVVLLADDVASIRAVKHLPDATFVLRRRRGGIAIRDVRAALGADPFAILRDDRALARAVDLAVLPSRPTRTTRAAARLAAHLKDTRA